MEFGPPTTATTKPNVLIVSVVGGGSFKIKKKIDPSVLPTAPDS